MKVNGIEIKGDLIAHDCCHKIYIIEDEEDKKQAEKAGYLICPIKNLQKIYEHLCELRFISNWKLTTFYAHQHEVALFDDERSE